MFKSLLKIASISALLSFNAFANTDLLIEGEFSKDASDEARYLFLEYQYERSSYSSSYESDCYALLGIYENRLTSVEFQELKENNYNQYRDRNLCAYIIEHKGKDKQNIQSINNWINVNSFYIEYINSNAKILDDIILVSKENGFSPKRCKLIEYYSTVYKNEMNKSNQYALDILKEKCD